MEVPQTPQTHPSNAMRQASKKHARPDRSCSEWDRLLHVELRPGLVAGRLTRPPAWRWCERARRGYIGARLLGVDSAGAELDVALMAYTQYDECSMNRLQGASVGDVVIAEGQIEYRAWSPSSVRMLVKESWLINNPPLLMRFGTLCEQWDAIKAFKTFECLKSARDLADGVVDDPFGHATSVDWFRTQIARKGLVEDEAIEHYTWGRIPDADPASVESDPAKRDQLFRRWDAERAALKQLAEMAFDGNMVAAMQFVCGFGGPGSDGSEEVLRRMMTGPWDELARDRLVQSRQALADSGRVTAVRSQRMGR